MHFRKRVLKFLTYNAWNICITVLLDTQSYFTQNLLIFTIQGQFTKTNKGIATPRQPPARLASSFPYRLSVNFDTILGSWFLIPYWSSLYVRIYSTGAPTTIDGTAQAAAGAAPFEARFEVVFPSVPFQIPAPYWVLDTDYTSYAVVYACNGFGFFHTSKFFLLVYNMSRRLFWLLEVVTRLFGIFRKKYENNFSKFWHGFCLSKYNFYYILYYALLTNWEILNLDGGETIPVQTSKLIECSSTFSYKEKGFVNSRNVKESLISIKWLKYKRFFDKYVNSFNRRHSV